MDFHSPCGKGKVYFVENLEENVESCHGERRLIW